LKRCTKLTVSVSVLNSISKNEVEDQLAEEAQEFNSDQLESTAAYFVSYY